MSYSFYEVLPFLLKKDRYGLGLNYDILNDKISKEEREELSEAFYEMTNEYDYESFTFSFPAFTGTHFETNETREFEAKTFNISVGSVDKRMGDCYEGKVWYHYVAEITDDDSGEKMVLVSYYYGATDHELIDLSISLDNESNTEEDIEEEGSELGDSFFAVIEVVKGKTKNHGVLHGVFTTLEGAMEGWESLEEESIFENSEAVQIERFPVNTPLIYSVESNANVLRDCIAIFDKDGQITHDFSEDDIEDE